MNMKMYTTYFVLLILVLSLLTGCKPSSADHPAIHDSTPSATSSAATAEKKTLLQSTVNTPVDSRLLGEQVKISWPHPDPDCLFYELTQQQRADYILGNYQVHCYYSVSYIDLSQAGSFRQACAAGKVRHHLNIAVKFPDSSAIILTPIDEDFNSAVYAEDIWQYYPAPQEDANHSGFDYPPLDDIDLIQNPSFLQWGETEIVIENIYSLDFDSNGLADHILRPGSAIYFETNKGDYLYSRNPRYDNGVLLLPMEAFSIIWSTHNPNMYELSQVWDLSVYDPSSENFNPDAPIPEIPPKQ